MEYVVCFTSAGRAMILYSYKATKPGLVSVLYLSMFFIVLLFIRAPLYVLLVFIVCVLSFGCSS